MISFEMPEKLQQTVTLMTMVAENMMRPSLATYDEHEHEIPWDYINFMHDANRQMGGGGFVPGAEKPKRGNGDEPKKEGPRLGYQRLAFSAEVLSWGDTGLYLCSPVGLLGAAAVAATGTPEQKQRFLTRFAGDKPVFDAMALTEPHAGSAMPAMVRTTAVRADDSWILNGEKIFVTGGHKALVDTQGFVVVWATIDPAAGRAGVRPFVIEAGTPGCEVTKLEHKLGIRASDTASIVLQDCRIPFDNILGSPEVEKKTTEGFKGAMATFDASRPMVAASALGVARATLEAAQGVPGGEGHSGALRAAAQPADQHRARADRYGGHAAFELAAGAQVGVDDGREEAEQPGSVDGQGPGRRRRRADDAEGGRAARTARATRASTCSRSGSAMPRSTTCTKAPGRSIA